MQFTAGLGVCGERGAVEVTMRELAGGGLERVR
jgi:hypothetical protein